MRLVREILKHGSRVEVPHRGAAHDVQTERTVNAKVESGIKLLHKSRLLCPTLNAQANGQWSNHALHEELAGEAEYNGVEGHKGEIGLALGILNGFTS